MSGRHGNRKGGRVGRGGGSGRDKGKSTPMTIHTKKTVEDDLFYVGSIKKASDYEISAEFVVNNINIIFERMNDVSEAW